MAPRDKQGAAIAVNLWDGEFAKLYERYMFLLMRLHQVQQEYIRLKEKLKQQKLDIWKLKRAARVRQYRLKRAQNQAQRDQSPL